MNLETLSLLRFEWVIIGIIFVLLVMKLADADAKVKPMLTAINVILLANFLLGLVPMSDGSLFNNFFRSTSLIVLQKNILNLGVLLISLTAYRYLSNIKNQIEYYILMLTSLLGMFVMISSGHVLMLYLGLEMSTIPVAALVNYNRKQRNSSEAGLKLIFSSAFSTGVLLFGISMLYGAVGSLDFTTIACNLEVNALTLMAFAFILGGFAFKMSVVPFHLWTADVYEGAPVSITSFLSVISKGSVIFVFMSALYSLFGHMEEAWLYIVSILAIITMTVGNLFTLRQQNIKRLLAFSSITQVGFVLVGIAGASAMANSSVIYFVLIYVLSNVAAFGVIGAISDTNGNETLSAYKGLYKSNPYLALILSLSLFSLAGVPPTAGFFGKLFLLTSGMGNALYVVLAFASINLVISLYNYLRVVKTMFMDEAEIELGKVETNFPLNIALIVCATGLIIIGFIPAIYNYISSLSYGI
ncbi:MAG: NADH-quinone oxidoreductase subunit N [Bacteroidales bacterium]|nr:NADH-quinone oxidoreductase subunit N [Bacteroidales bacterium]